MSLEEQIAQIVDPGEFTRLCNIVFTAEYGHGYQVIDGTRSDEGNDGWVKIESRILAIHCPVKPERKTDAGYVGKALSDLEKALILRDSGALDVQRWTFVTPRKLTNDVVLQIANKGKAIGIEVNHIESTFLVVRLLKHPELIKEFPGLHVSHLEEFVRSAVEWAPGALRKETREPENDIHHINDVRSAATEDPALLEVVELRERGGKDAKAKLRAIFYSASDPNVQLNAVMALLDLFAPADDSAMDLANLCEAAIGAAKRLNSRSAEAYLLAYRGYYLSIQFSWVDMQRRVHVIAESRTGIPLSTPEQDAATTRRLQELFKGFTEAFKTALQSARESNSPVAMAAVLIPLGNAAGQRAGYLRQVGATEDSNAERDVCRRALLCAKDLYAAMNYELGVANVQMNLANQIRFLGEEQSAKHLVALVVPVAERHGDLQLLKKANWLKESLETGRIPDYMAGERR